MTIARVTELWRYPVKSMAGEKLDRSSLGAAGIPGDRGWAVRDEVRGGIRGAKKLPGLMRCSARYLEEPSEGASRVPVAEITLPNGERVRADAPGAADKVGAALGTRVTLWPLQPATDLDHYRRGAADHEDLEVELREVFGREKSEPLPDLSKFPPEIFEFESPPGTYFDVAPLLVMTDATLGRLQALSPASTVDVRRFRPNILLGVDTDTAASNGGFPEAVWAGRRLRVGDAVLELTLACPRCVMISLPFADLPKDSALLRTVVRDAGQVAGVYARVEKPGAVRVGDPVEFVG
jgi:uncharacterized protein YcbX